MPTINSILNDFIRLDYDTREMLLEILQKRQIESRRNDIAKSAKRSIKEYQAGKIQPESAEILISRLSVL